MSDQLQEKRDELRLLRKREELRQLRAASPHEPQETDPGFVEGVAQDVLPVMQDVGKAALGAAGTVSTAIDQYAPWGAALNAGIGAKQNGGSFWDAYRQQYGEDPAQAPSNKDIMVNAGLSAEESPTPIIANPFTMEKFKASPAGIAGGVYGAAKDPTTYLGLGEAKALGLGAEALEAATPRAVSALDHFARERAVKAATGNSIKNVKRMARVSGDSASDVDKAIGELRRSGQILLSPDQTAGFKKPAVGWFSRAKDIAEESAARKDVYGKQMGAAGELADQLNPTGISPQEIAKDVAAFRSKIPAAGSGTSVRNRLAEEVSNIQNFDLDGRLGPASPLTFQRSQQLKGQFKFDPQNPDLLISNQDASNKVNQIIKAHQENAIDDALAKAEIPEQQAILKGFGPAKEKWAVFDKAADAGADQAFRRVSNRFVSPSSHGIGGAVGIAGADTADSLAKGGLYGLAAAALNQQILQRGAAFSARSANAIARKLQKAPGMYQKWLPTMQKAAATGNAAVLATHHQLMQNDPDYRRLMLAEEQASLP